MDGSMEAYQDDGGIKKVISKDSDILGECAWCSHPVERRDMARFADQLVHAACLPRIYGEESWDAARSLMFHRLAGPCAKALGLDAARPILDSIDSPNKRPSDVFTILVTLETRLRTGPVADNDAATRATAALVNAKDLLRRYMPRK